MLATRGVILTAENLRKRKVVCLRWCFLCKEQVRRWTIFCYIAIKPRLYGNISLNGLEFLGLCQEPLRSCFSAGRVELGEEGKKLEILLLLL